MNMEHSTSHIRWGGQAAEGSWGRKSSAPGRTQLLGTPGAAGTAELSSAHTAPPKDCKGEEFASGIIPTATCKPDHTDPFIQLSRCWF